MKKINFLTIPVLFLITFASAPFAAAGGPLCTDIFAPAWGTLRPDFQHNTSYTKEIPQETEIKDQCSLGTCHLHSWLANIEKTYTLRTGKVITLSNHYLSALQLLHRSLELIKYGDTIKDGKIVVKPSLGAGPLVSRDTILKYGLIPEGTWIPKTEFYEDVESKRIQEYLSNIIGRAKARAAKVETDEEKAAIKNEAAAQIQAMLRDVIGELPTTITWNGQELTPQEFSQKYFPFLTDPQTQAIIMSNRKETPNDRKSGKDRIINTTINEVEKLAAQMIDRGQMVYLSYEHHKEYVDKTTGIMSIRAFYIPEYAKPLTRQERAQYDGKNDGGHAVQIVGYERSPYTGQIVKWKIKNSWGDQSGDQGYYHMYNDYFRTFAKSITYSEAPPGVVLKMPVKGN